MGEVAFRAATYLVEKLNAEEFASLNAEAFFYLAGSMVKDGLLSASDLPESKFYFWKNKKGKNDLIIFLSNAQPDLARAEGYSKIIIQVAKSFKVDKVVSFASMPQGIDHTQDPGVWFAATSQDLSNDLKRFNFKSLKEGLISGMNGLFLGIAKRENIDGFCLLGEIPLYTIQIENPKASRAVLEALFAITGIRVDSSGLFMQAQAMEDEINKLLDYLKLGSAASGPIGEEDIEKIKKTLNQLTKLPVSVKERIEQFFAQAKTDISKAHELKVELDKWNIYKEYEDRFLDLFKKTGEKNN
jgi:hypothetical protein